MDPRAIEQAQRARERAGRAVDKLDSGKSFEDFEDAWEDFLFALSKIYEKLRGGATGHPASWAWFKKKMDERRDDPTLLYLHKARNADHHRIEDVTKKEGWNFVSKDPVHGVLFHKIERIRLVPVRDKEGNVYPVPSKIRSREYEPGHPSLTAFVTLVYVDTYLIKEAISLRR